MPALNATCSADSVSRAVDPDTLEPTPAGATTLVGRVLSDRYRIENVVNAGANLVIAEAIDTAANRKATMAKVLEFLKPTAAERIQNDVSNGREGLLIEDARTSEGADREALEKADSLPRAAKRVLEKNFPQSDYLKAGGVKKSSSWWRLW